MNWVPAYVAAVYRKGALVLMISGSPIALGTRYYARHKQRAGLYCCRSPKLSLEAVAFLH